MRSDHVSIVRSTWALATPNAESIGLGFYARLFELDPALRMLFPLDVRAQTTKLMQTLAVAIASLDRLETLTPALELLGRRHVGYGVHDSHYETVGRALLDTLAGAFGGAFTEDVRLAWTETYTALAGVMRRAASEAIAERRDVEQRAAAHLMRTMPTAADAAVA
jgi:hemoglobin-like flavoprotein